jgi:hypothetical protein
VAGGQEAIEDDPGGQQPGAALCPGSSYLPYSKQEGGAASISDYTTSRPSSRLPNIPVYLTPLGYLLD